MPSEKNWTILDLINWGKEYFARKGIESPRLNMELLLCYVLRMERIALYTNFEKPLKQNELDRLRGMVKRRAKREPLQYITGETDFCGLKIGVNSTVLVPRPETELMADSIIRILNGDLPLAKTDDKAQTILKKISKSPSKILDIGTGSGCIAIALAKNLTGCDIHACDISSEALETARKNASDNNIDGIHFSKFDILKQLPEGGPFDIIVSNPPYIPVEEYGKLEPEVNVWEPSFALTDNREGLTFYERFADIFESLLAAGGAFFLENGWGQFDKIQKLFESKSFVLGAILDYEGVERISIGLTEN